MEASTSIGTESAAAIASALKHRRDAVAASWQTYGTVVLLGAGEPIPRPGRGDLTYPFESHSEYYYLTDRNAPGGVLAYDPADGWIDFLAPVTSEEQMWTGAAPLAAEVRTTAQLENWLAARAARPIAWLGSPPPDATLDHALNEELRIDLDRIRRIKDPVELARLRVAQRAIAAAIAAVVPLLRAGVSERHVQRELEAVAYRAGAEGLAFETVVAGGPNSAVLHIAPTDRKLAAGELVLIDAGVEYRGYASDVSRTYPVGGAFDSAQEQLHTIVHQAEQASIERCRPGTEWRDVHLTASLIIAAGLVDFGILKGAPETLVESGAVSLFFPHGIGHLLGLSARDAGASPSRERRHDPQPYPNLRMNLPLEAGMVSTVEPGIYFVPAILDDPENRRAHREDVRWGRVEQMLGFGGIRIEDDILITTDGSEILSGAIPLLG